MAGHDTHVEYAALIPSEVFMPWVEEVAEDIFVRPAQDVLHLALEVKVALDSLGLSFLRANPSEVGGVVLVFSTSEYRLSIVLFNIDEVYVELLQKGQEHQEWIGSRREFEAGGLAVIRGIASQIGTASGV